MTTPKLGERVLLIPQAVAKLTNPHLLAENAIGQPPHVVTPVAGDRLLDWKRGVQPVPSWETYTSTLVREGFGVMVVRDGKLQVGPARWDSGD